MTRPPKRPARSRAALRRKPSTAPPRVEIGLEPDLRELRSAVANLRAAAEALGAAARGRGGRNAALLAAVIEEAERASRTVDRLTALADRRAAAQRAARAIPASQLAADIARQAASELDLAVHLSAPIDESLTVSPSFVAAIVGALGRLRRDFSVGEVALSARRLGDLLSLELAFSAREPESSRLREEHTTVLAGGPDGEPALGDEARAAGGEAWLAIRRGEATFSLRVLLPLSPAS